MRLSDEVARLRNQLEDANAEIAYLKIELRAPDAGDQMRRALRLSTQQHRLLSAIVKVSPVTVSNERLLHSMGGRTEPDHQLLKVVLHNVRKKLKPIGVTISTVWGIGVFMSREDKARLDAFVESAVDA